MLINTITKYVKEKSRKRSLGISSILLLFFAAGMDANAAQNMGHTQEGSDTVLVQMLASQDAAEDEMLTTMQVVDMNLADALELLAEKLRVGISFNSEIIPDKKVSLDMKNVPVYEVLYKLLEGTNLEPVLPPNKNVIVIRKKESVEMFQQTVSGTVVDAQTGESLPGVNILIEGTSTGTSTDVDGDFELDLPDLEQTLIITYIGYDRQEVSLNGRNELNIELIQSIISGEELVVVGYGTQRQSNITGAISRVTREQLEQVQEQPLTNPMQGLAGRVSGVQVQQTGHAPGNEGFAVRIRGTGSISAGNEPLYVLDGFALEDGASALNIISPHDIESVEILKDASATAIYGSRGGNGVVLITTKDGQSGSPRFEFSTQTGFQQIGHKPEMMDTYDYVEWFIDGHNNAWIQAGGSADDPNEVRTESYYMIPDAYLDPASLPNVNWVDEIFRTAPIQNYQGSVSGGSENTSYLFGGGYANQKGIMIGSNYEKMNIRADVSGTVRDRLNLGMSLNASYSNTNNVDEGRNSPADFSLRAPPTNPVWNENLNQYGMALNSEYFVGDDASPVEAAVGKDDKDKNYRTLWRGFANFDLAPGININTSLGGLFNNNRNSYYRPSYFSYDSNLAPNPVDAESSTNVTVDWLWENTINFTESFGQNEFDVVAGFTYQTRTNESNEVEASNFANDDIRTLNAGQVTDGGSFFSESSLISYLGRVNYNFDNKYLLTATARADGSSRFGRNKKWGFFPSASAGWRISEESFMQNASFISELKLRLSYGLTGNNSIPNYGSIGLLQTVNNVVGAGLGNVVTGIAPSTISNPDLSWEKTEQVDLGLEIGLFENRIFMEVDFYNSVTNDLLLNVPISTITGFSSQLQNLGKVRNRGVEISLHTRNFQGTQASWNTSFNIAFNRNIVLGTGPADEPIYGSTNNAPNAWITTVGEPIASFYGYDFIGVFQTEADLQNYPHLTTDGLGDPIIRDVNGDGVINADDRTIIGNNQPDFIFGFSNNFAYRNFDLNVHITGNYGAEVFNITSRFNKWFHGDRNARKSMVNRYRSPEEPGDGHHFIANRLYQGLQREASSYWVEDGSYLRIENVALGYNIREINSIPIRSARIYLSARNLFTFTNYWGYDPEVSTAGSGLARGADWGGYPPARVVTLGINVSI